MNLMNDSKALRAELQVKVEVLEGATGDPLGAARNAAAAYCLGPLPTLVVSGADRKSWLNGLLTCDVMAVAPRRAEFGLLLNRLGKIQASTLVVEHQDRLLVVVLWGDVEVVQRELDARLIMEDAELSRSEADWAWWLLIGPQAKALGDVDPQAPGGHLQLFAGSVVVGLTPNRQAPALPHLSSAHWTWLRARHRVPWGGIDFDSQDRPHEAGLDRTAVSWSKGCYLGQEVVCMQDMRGKVKRTVRTMEAGPVLPSDWPLTLDAHVRDERGANVGTVTSAVYDGDTQGWLVLAALPAGEPAGPEPQWSWEALPEQGWRLRASDGATLL